MPEFFQPLMDIAATFLVERFELFNHFLPFTIAAFSL